MSANVSSDPKQRLDRAPLVHGAIAFGHVGERQFEVEHLAGVDLAAQHQSPSDAAGSGAPARGRPSCRSGRRTATGRRTARHGARRHSRSSRPGGRTGSPGPSIPACPRIPARNRRRCPCVSSLTRATPASPRSEMMSVAPYSWARSWRLLCRLIAMMRAGPHLPGRQHPHQAHRAVADDDHRRARPDPRRIRRVPAGAQHVRRGQKAGDQVVVGHFCGRDQRAVGQGNARVGTPAPRT